MFLLFGEEDGRVDHDALDAAVFLQDAFQSGSATGVRQQISRRALRYHPVVKIYEFINIYKQSSSWIESSLRLTLVVLVAEACKLV